MQQRLVRYRQRLVYSLSMYSIIILKNGIFFQKCVLYYHDSATVIKLKKFHSDGSLKIVGFTCNGKLLEDTLYW